MEKGDERFYMSDAGERPFFDEAVEMIKMEFPSFADEASAVLNDLLEEKVMEEIE